MKTPYILRTSPVLLQNRISRHLVNSALIRFFYRIGHQDTLHAQRQSGSFTQSDIKKPYILRASPVRCTLHTQNQSGSFTQSDTKTPYILSASPVLLHNPTSTNLTYSALVRFVVMISHLVDRTFGSWLESSVNSLSTWRFEWNIRQVIGLCEITLSLDLADVKSTSVQAMAKYSQATMWLWASSSDLKSTLGKFLVFWSNVHQRSWA